MSKLSRSSPTICPQCAHLCVGAYVLPCSHLLCRKCLLILLDRHPGIDMYCPTCNSVVLPADAPLPRQVEQFPADAVMQRLVMRKLTEQAGGRCHVPHPSPSGIPSHVCLDCGDMFCDSCTHVHRNTSMSKHHSLLTLESLEAKESSSERAGDDAGGSQDSQHSLLQHAVNTEVDLLRQAMSASDVVIDDLKDLLAHRQDDRHTLQAYSHHLLTDDVRSSDVILRRSRHVRQQCTSVAEADMENLQKMQSRKVPDNKLETQDTSQSNLPAKPAMPNQGLSCPERTEWLRRLLRLTWTSDNLTVWVSVSVLVTLLLGLLVVMLCPSPPATYTTDRVVLQPLDIPSFLTGSAPGGHSCSSHLNDGITDVLVTRDGQVVMATDQRQSLLVLSSSGTHMVKLGNDPWRLAQLPSGLIAVICPWTSDVLLVDLDSGPQQIQRLHTAKNYWAVAAHPEGDALIVGALEEFSVDLINLQGQVIRTLVDTSQVNLQKITSLAVNHDDLLFTGVKSKQVHRVPLTKPSLPPVEALPGNLTSVPVDMVMDKLGDVFLILSNGDVLIGRPGGDYRQLLKGRASEATVGLRLALHHDRLLVVTVTDTFSGYRTDVTEYQLLVQ